MTQTTAWPRRLSLPLVAAIALAALVVTLWLPFGWKVTGLYEEWIYLGDIEARTPLQMLWNPPYSSTTTRPLTLVSYLLAYLLTPDSFVALNIIAALILFGKGLAMYFLVRRLVPANSALALVSAALLVVYPADDALLTLRTTNVHAGVFLLVVALNTLIVAYERFGWATLFAMLVAEVVALATYEAGLLLMFCAPVLLVWLRRGTDKRLIVVAALWEAPGIYFFLVHVMEMLRDPASYPAQLMASSGLARSSLQILGAWLYSVTRAYIRVFATGWYHALPAPDWRDPYLHLAAGLVVFVLLPAVWMHATQSEESEPAMDTRQYVLLASLGVVAVLPGFALFLPTSWRNTNYRVFLFSSIGAALAVGIVCWLSARVFNEWRRGVFVGFTSLLIGIATFHALVQHDGYFADSQRQQRILAGIITQAPRVAPGTTVLVLDRTPTEAYTAWSMCWFVSVCLEAGLQYLYEDPGLHGTYCAPGYRPRGQASEECHFEADRVTVSYIHPGTKKEMRTSAAYDSLVVFENSVHGLSVLDDISRYSSQAGAAGYEPRRRIDASSPISYRARAVFDRWPFEVRTPRSAWRLGTTPPQGSPR